MSTVLLDSKIIADLEKRQGVGYISRKAELAAAA